jgi:ankyrin repeat protein
MLHLACMHGSIEIVDFLIFKVGAKPWLTSKEDDMTTLHLASWCGHLSVVKLLIERVSRVKVNIRTATSHNTPLHFAAWSNQLQICKYLLSEGANIASKNSVIVVFCCC